MALYMIGIGLSDEKDISVRGFELVKKCDLVYLESYTSKLACSVEKLEKFYNKKIILADRDQVENKSSEIIENSKSKKVAFLVIGDVLSATTHITLLMDARKSGVQVEIVHNASILTAVGETGLELYKFGRVASIPFNNKDVKIPIEIYKMNNKNNLHTLFLFDLDPIKDRFMDFNTAISYLLNNKINKKTMAVACAAIGTVDSFVRYGTLEEISKLKIEKYPQCLIIPSEKMHFVEEDALQMYKRK